MNQNKPVVYAFIDSQNLNLGTSQNVYKKGRKVYSGWKLDYAKFFRHLKDKFRVTKTFLFIGYVSENKQLYRKLSQFGYVLVFKPVVKNQNLKPKGNIDAELVLHAAAIEFENYNKAVVVSGDGDFACLYHFLRERNKLLAVIVPNRYTESSLLRPFLAYRFLLDGQKRKLEKKVEGVTLRHAV